MVLRICRTPMHRLRLFVDNARRVSTGGSRRSLATVYLGLGSNVGDRPANLLRAYKGLREIGQVDVTSFLYETVPMYLEDQPRFLNAACRLSTELGPVDLLERVKNLEMAIGRKQSTRWGPRAVDIDILVYDGLVIDDAGKGAITGGRDGTIERKVHNDEGLKRGQRWLQVPHPKMHERPFVLLPLVDIEPDLVHPVLGSTAKELLRKVLSPKDQSSGVGGRRVLPMGTNSGGTRLWPLNAVGSRTCVMGILNTTPDSFSDGGLHNDTSGAIDHALKMVRDGADIVDIGGESTRPGAADVTEDVEISRVVPIVEGLRGAALDDEDNNFSISVDTRRAAVAEAALAAGAHLVNDVSGGTFDPGMLSAVAKAGVPLVMMHMRGTPKIMTTLTDYGGDVVGDVCNAFEERTRAAESVGVPRWLHILDPGIGFAKTNSQSLELLRSLDSVATRVKSPLLVGPSRKRFIGELTGEEDAPRRDWGTAGACCSAAERGAKIVRVHNVRGVRQALAVSDAVRDARRCE